MDWPSLGDTFLQTPKSACACQPQYMHLLHTSTAFTCLRLSQRKLLLMLAEDIDKFTDSVYNTPDLLYRLSCNDGYEFGVQAKRVITGFMKCIMMDWFCLQDCMGTAPFLTQHCFPGEMDTPPPTFTSIVQILDELLLSAAVCQPNYHIPNPPQPTSLLRSSLIGWLLGCHYTDQGKCQGSFTTSSLIYFSVFWEITLLYSRLSISF